MHYYNCRFVNDVNYRKLTINPHSGLMYKINFFEELEVNGKFSVSKFKFMFPKNAIYYRYMGSLLIFIGEIRIKKRNER